MEQDIGSLNPLGGIKQGDSLYPSLFVLGAELLSRLMNQLPAKGFIPYSSERKGPLINHLCYADDTILFSSGDHLSLKMMMSKLDTYERTSCQMINKRKSGFYVSSNFPEPFITEVENITCFPHLQFPMQYLGFPIYVGRKKVVFSTTWLLKFLTECKGGKETSILWW